MSLRVATKVKKEAHSYIFPFLSRFWTGINVKSLIFETAKRRWLHNSSQHDPHRQFAEIKPKSLMLSG
jgi:hypothetical protein